MNKKISIRCCVLLCLICLIFSSVAFGSLNIKEIVAYLNYGVRIMLDGKEQILYDVDGNRIYPISYNGTTYVPIRGISNLLDVSVDWDNDTETVILKRKQYSKESLIKGTEEKTSFSNILTEEKDRIFMKNNEKCVAENGLICKIIQNQDFTFDDYIAIDISNNYKSVEFMAISNLDCSVNVFNQNGHLLKTFRVKSENNDIYSLSMDSSHNNKLYFVCIQENSEDINGGSIKILNLYGRN